MIFYLVSILVPVGVYFFLPSIIKVLAKRQVTSRSLLVAAGLCFFISWYLPSPLIQGKNTAFTTHFLGGGVFTGLIWLYIKDQLKIKLSPYFELLTLYALVSALGVANELFELLLVQLKLIRLNQSDTWWDLLANTLGVIIFWFVYRLYIRRR